MPHDNKGDLLQVGDKVAILCTVKSIDSTTEDYCNITVETDVPCLPGDCKNSYALNARQVEKIA